MTNETNLSLILINTNWELCEAYMEDELKEYLKKWKIESMQRYKNKSIMGVILTKKIKEYEIAIITGLNTIIEIESKKMILMPEWLSKEINKIYK